MVVALGGNALLREGEEATFRNQILNVVRAAHSLAPSFSKIERGFALVHGNGPQVGDEYLRNEYSAGHVPSMPLHVLGAESQALIGSMLELALLDEFIQTGSKKKVCTVITHTVVDPNDPAFSRPSKPVGPFYTKKQLDDELSKEKFDYVTQDGRYRKVVASPKPLEILELEQIKSLIDKGYIVICCGGGGSPVHKVDGKGYRGTDAVIDKDRTAQLLATSLRADELVILTNPEKVYWDYGTNKKPIDTISAKKLKPELGSFEDGSMRPKLEACINFIENGGKAARIGSLYKFDDVIAGKNCTTIN